MGEPWSSRAEPYLSRFSSWRSSLLCGSMVAPVCLRLHWTVFVFGFLNFLELRSHSAVVQDCLLASGFWGTTGALSVLECLSLGTKRKKNKKFC
jgi:hypothetical protein